MYGARWNKLVGDGLEKRREQPKSGAGGLRSCTGQAEGANQARQDFTSWQRSLAEMGSVTAHSPSSDANWKYYYSRM